MEFQQKGFKMIHDYRASSLLHRYFIGFPKGTTVILPVNICEIVHQVVIKSGLIPFFVDISEKYSFTINQNQVVDYFEKSKNRNSILLLNHTYGVSFSFCHFVNFLKSNFNVSIIEDKCLSLPDFNINRNIDLTVFSTGYSKIVDIGIGGLGVMKESIFLNSPTHYFGENFNAIKELSLNEYLMNIAKKKHPILQRKKVINKIYTDYLNLFMMGEEYNNWRFCVRVGNKDFLLKKIFEHKLFASSHYRPLNECRIIYKTSWDLFHSVINLFNDQHITEDQAFECSKIIREYGTFQ